MLLEEGFSLLRCCRKIKYNIILWKIYLGKFFSIIMGILRNSHTMEKYIFWILWLKVHKVPVHGKAPDFVCLLPGRCSTGKTCICISPLFRASTSSSVISLLIWNVFSRVPMCTSSPEKPFMNFIEISSVADK